MSHYVDGFVLPVSKNRLEEYRRVATMAAKVWKEHGALSYWECVGDDMDAHEMVAFPQAVGAGEDEVVMFSWIVFESREKRDEVNAKVMEDERLKDVCGEDSAFNYKRMIYGGFRSIVEG